MRISVLSLTPVLLIRALENVRLIDLAQCPPLPTTLAMSGNMRKYTYIYIYISCICFSFYHNSTHLTWRTAWNALCVLLKSLLKGSEWISLSSTKWHTDPHHTCKTFVFYRHEKLLFCYYCIVCWGLSIKKITLLKVAPTQMVKEHRRSLKINDSTFLASPCAIYWSQMSVENKDAVGAAPTDEAPIASEWSTILLATIVRLIKEVRWH